MLWLVPKYFFKLSYKTPAYLWFHPYAIADVGKLDPNNNVSASNTDWWLLMEIRREEKVIKWKLITGPSRANGGWEAKPDAATMVYLPTLWRNLKKNVWPSSLLIYQFHEIFL